MVAHSAAGSSCASSAQSSSKFSLLRRTRANQEQHDGHGDTLVGRRSSSIENGIFGVLFTLSKEKSDTRVRIRWVLLKVALDTWQLFTTVINPAAQGWRINANSTAWKAVAVLNFAWLADLGYGAYLAVLYSMLALLAVNVGMCVWVAWCFKEQKFPVVWPIQALRVFSSVFFQAFDVASLNLLQLGISCRYTGPVEPHLRFSLFPSYSCAAPPHILHAIVSALCLLVFVVIGLLLNMSEVEVNPLSRRPLALGHSGGEVAAFAIKVLLTMVDVFIGWRRVAACLYLALSLALAWDCIRWNPNLVAWVNYLKSGSSVSIVWCSAMLMLLVFHPGVGPDRMDSWALGLTAAMFAGLAPAFAAGAWMSRALMRRMTKTALDALASAGPQDRLEDVCENLDSPRDVELVARCCRVWKDRYTLHPEAVNRAHQVIKAGLAMFPGSAYMVLLHANFMIDVLGVSQSGSRRIQDARKLNPGIMCRFIMFVRQQQATQKAAGNSTNDGAHMDLLGYVEYQRKQRMVVRLHREALQAMCNFWKALDSSSVSFTHLSKALGKIESSVSQAQAAYRAALESYGNSPSLVRLYGKFLLTIKNDPWTASEYFGEAERLEEIKHGDASGPLLPDGTPLGRMDELSIAVLVMNATGEVQMANRQTHACFGYKRGTLEGKPMSALLAPHCSRWLATQLAEIVSESSVASTAAAHDPEEPGTGHEFFVVGMHCERLAIPLRVSLSRASGVGEDSTIIALLEPIPPVRGMASLWVTANGTVAACDPQFAIMFGWSAAEVNGASLLTFMALPDAEQQQQQQQADGKPQRALNGSGVVKRLIQLANSGEGRDPTLPCTVAHKYDSVPVACSIRLSKKESVDMPVHELRIRLVDQDPPQLLVVSTRGVIVHAAAELAARLKDAGGAAAANRPRPGAAGGGAGGSRADGGGGGAALLGSVVPTADVLSGYTFFDFLPSPWKDMHTKLLRDTTALTAPGRGPWSCRRGSSPGPTLELRTASGKPLFMHVRVDTSEAAGEVNHVVRMSGSSLEAALEERRLRLSLSQDGIVSGVTHGSPKLLFGMEQNQIVGRALWDVVEGLTPADGDGSAVQGLLSLGGLVSRALSSPEHSWRVTLVPPPRPSAMGLPIATTARQALAKPAVLQVYMDSPTDDHLIPAVYVDLWPLPSVSGVLELDGSGRIASVLEGAVRPAGLLFGMSSGALVGSMFADLVELPPGRSAPADLLMRSGDKKSSLKANKKEVHVKVGPVHTLRALHSDGRPLALEVQAVGKPLPGQPLTIVLRFHQAPMQPAGAASGSRPAFGASKLSRLLTSRTATGAAAAESDASTSTGVPRQTAASLPVATVTEPQAAVEVAPVHPLPSPRNPTRLSESYPLAREPLVIDVSQIGGSAPPTSPGATATPTGQISRRPTISPDSVTLQAKQSGLLDLFPSGFSNTALLPLPSVAAAGKAGPYGSRSALDDLIRQVGSERAASSNDLQKLRAGSRVGSMLAHAAGPQAQPREVRRPTLPGAAPATLQGYVGANKGPTDQHGEDPLLHGIADVGSDAGSLEDGVVKELKSKISSISVGPTGRVLEWVESKGAYYQNSVCPSAKSDDEKSKGSDDVADRVVPAKYPSPLRARGHRGEPEHKGHPAPTSKQHGGAEATDPDEDAPSEAGQSGVSGLSGAGGAEYKRGKRFKKLAKLMDSSQAQQVQRRFRTHALVTVAVLVTVHVICFVLTIRAIKSQQDAMLQLGRSGQAQRYMHRILTDVRSLDVISKNKALPHLYTAADAETFVRRIASDAEEVKTRFNDIHDSHHDSSSPVNELFYFTQHLVWNGVHLNGTDKYSNVTVWDFVTRFFTMAKSIEQDYDKWQQANETVIIADTVPAQFLLKSGPDLFRVSRKILDALLYVAVDITEWADILQLVFLAVEGTFVSCLAACYLAYLLRAVAAQRYKLYCLFLVIPLGLTRALASQNTSLFVEDEDEEEEEEEEKPQQRSADNASTAGDDADGKIKRRATLKLEEEDKAGRGPSPGGRPSSAARRRNAGPGGSGATSNGVPDGQDRGASDDKYDKLLAFPGGSIAANARGCWAWVKWRARRLMSRRGKQASPLLPRSSSSGFAAVGKRTLRNNSHQTAIMLAPFVVWSALVIAIYATAVVNMKGLVSVVAVHSVVNFMAARTYRSVFYAQELAVIEDPAQLPAGRAAVARCMKLVKDAWYTLQLGDEAYRSTGPDTEHFPLVTHGLSYASPQLEELFYRNGGCHRSSEDLPCPGTDYRFYQISRTGVDSIMQQFIISLDAMATNESSVPEGLADDDFDFIYSVGRVDLLDGTIRIADAHYDTLEQTYSNVLIFHIALFLLLFVIFLAFLLFQLNPLMRRISKERRQIAELMSQLPLELDVEKLIERALGGTATSTAGSPSNQGTGTSGGGPAEQPAAPSEAQALLGDQDDNDTADATQKWKAIIRAASSLSGKTPNGGLTRRRSSLTGPVVLH